MKEKSIFAEQKTVNSLDNGKDAEENRSSAITEASFETAISATGFGKFNVILIAFAVPCGWASMMDSTAMSYVVPAAHCDLELDLQKRGILNAISYLGMISSALLWGFLADTLGRRKIIVVGLFLDVVFVILAMLSQTYQMLVATKFFTGLIVNGPFAVLTTLMSEFHSAKYRARMVMGLGSILSLAQLIMPGLGWLIIPLNTTYESLDGRFRIHSWNFFIGICAIPGLISAIGFYFLPESPKFLMTVGRNDEAIATFKKIYRMNTGMHPDTYPVKSLVDEIKMNEGTKHGGLVTANRNKVQALREGWQQIVPIFFPPHGLKLLLACIIQFSFLMGMNTIRLWSPQIFTAINDYQAMYPNDSATLCTMLEIIKPNENVTVATECVVNSVNDFVYINAMIVAGASIIGFTAITSVINKTGKKPSMIVLGIISGIVTTCIYFAYNSAMTVAFITMNITLVMVNISIETTIIVDMFPTTLRAIAVSITLMLGRCGAMIGNVVFPYLLLLGCLQPFVLIGCFLIGASLLVMFLPKTDMKALE